jgi:hypothetical protein
MYLHTYFDLRDIFKILIYLQGSYLCSVLTSSFSFFIFILFLIFLCTLESISTQFVKPQIKENSKFPVTHFNKHLVLIYFLIIIL